MRQPLKVSPLLQFDKVSDITIAVCVAVACVLPVLPVKAQAILLDVLQGDLTSVDCLFLSEANLDTDVGHHGFWICRSNSVLARDAPCRNAGVDLGVIVGKSRR